MGRASLWMMTERIIDSFQTRSKFQKRLTVGIIMDCPQKRLRFWERKLRNQYLHSKNISKLCKT